MRLLVYVHVISVSGVHKAASVSMRASTMMSKGVVVRKSISASMSMMRSISISTASSMPKTPSASCIGLLMSMITHTSMVIRTSKVQVQVQV